MDGSDLTGQPRAARRPIARTQRVVLGQLSPAARAALHAAAFAIYTRYKSGIDQGTFVRQFFADDAARVLLCHADDGELVGFACAWLARLHHDGREHAVYGALLFIDTRFRGVREATRFAVLEALRFKLREPWTPLAYMGVVTSPASYRMFAVTMPTFYPRPDAETPPPIAALVREAAARRGLVFADEARAVVRSLGTVRDPARLLHASSLQGDPAAQFYLRQNPRFADGEALLLWVPLTLRNLLGGLARTLGLGARPG